MREFAVFSRGVQAPGAEQIGFPSPTKTRPTETPKG